MKAANDNTPSISTATLLAEQYHGAAVIPVDTVCRDYFSHLDPHKFIRKVNAGDIQIPLVRMEESQKAARGIHLLDLATYLDARRAAAVKECTQLAA